jgi:hypothetical protein
MGGASNEIVGSSGKRTPKNADQKTAARREEGDQKHVAVIEKGAERIVEDKTRKRYQAPF